jgi:hypothetical protein
MNYERYTEWEISSDSLEYRFISSGPMGDIPKIIQFQATFIPDMYNLSFGDICQDGSIDDLVVNNNRDRNKVLATVAVAVYEFTRNYPEKTVFFSGSTPERTRLYRMAITLNYERLMLDFEILGIVRDMNAFLDVPFERGVNYFGFLLKRKISKFE